MKFKAYRLWIENVMNALQVIYSSLSAILSPQQAKGFVYTTPVHHAKGLGQNPSTLGKNHFGKIMTLSFKSISLIILPLLLSFMVTLLPKDIRLFDWIVASLNRDSEDCSLSKFYIASILKSFLYLVYSIIHPFQWAEIISYCKLLQVQWLHFGFNRSSHLIICHLKFKLFIHSQQRFLLHSKENACYFLWGISNLYNYCKKSKHQKF